LEFALDDESDVKTGGAGLSMSEKKSASPQKNFIFFALGV
jgi:hypothetical protein